MTPKLKASELCGKYNLIFSKGKEWISANDIKRAKQCALIAVDEIIKVNPVKEQGFVFVRDFHYWNAVRVEIEKL